jgi:hypothetical protein
MTIDKLIEAVEAGDDDAVNTITFGMSSAAKNKGKCLPAHEMLLAYFHGSLDAAKDVHDALLPGVRVEIFGPDTDNWGVHWGVTLPGRASPRTTIDTVFGPDLARAWLLAILKAKQAEGRG